MDRLRTRSGLDLNAVDVATTGVSFDKNIAYATVAFHPKGDTSVSGGMVMKYTLENRADNWVVVNVQDSRSGGEHSSGGTVQLPPGHPAITGSSPQSSKDLSQTETTSSKPSGEATGVNGRK